VSADLNGELGLSNLFLHGERRNDLQAEVLAGPTTVTNAATVVDALAMADIAYDGRRYLLLVNSANAAVTARVTGLPRGEAHVTPVLTSANAAMTFSTAGALTLDLRPLDVIALRVDAVWNADADADGQVDAADFLAWQRNVGGVTDAGPAAGDFNYDGAVNQSDLAAWQVQRTASTSSVVTLPEPSSCLGLALGSACLYRRGRHVCGPSCLPPRRCRPSYGK
jgi:hypothetical protein